MDAEKAKLSEAELEAYYASKKAEWDKYAQIETAKEEEKISDCQNDEIRKRTIRKNNEIYRLDR